MAGDIVVIDKQLVEDDLGHGGFDAGAAPAEEGLRLGEQVEGHGEEAPTLVELACGVGQLGLNLAALAADRVQLVFDLGLGPARLADQIQVLLLLDVELAQPGRQPLLEAVDAAKLGQQGVLQLGADGGLERLAQLHAAVVAVDGPLDIADPQQGLVALMVLATAYEGAVAGSGGPARILRDLRSVHPEDVDQVNATLVFQD